MKQCEEPKRGLHSHMEQHVPVIEVNVLLLHILAAAIIVFLVTVAAFLIGGLLCLFQPPQFEYVHGRIHIRPERAPCALFFSLAECVRLSNGNFGYCGARRRLSRLGRFLAGLHGSLGGLNWHKSGLSFACAVVGGDAWYFPGPTRQEPIPACSLPCTFFPFLQPLLVRRLAGATFPGAAASKSCCFPWYCYYGKLRRAAPHWHLCAPSTRPPVDPLR